MNHLQNSTGLMGDFITGKSLGRDGVTVLDDPNDFGQEWQVLESESKLFLVDRPPQAPQEQCRLAKKKPQVSSEFESKKDKLLREAAEKTCMQWAPQNKDACVMDVLAAGDLDLAKATW